MPLVQLTTKQLKVLEAAEKRPPGVPGGRPRETRSPPTQGTSINLKKAFEKPCHRCGRKNHEAKDCFHKESICKLCGKKAMSQKHATRKVLKKKWNNKHRKETQGPLQKSSKRQKRAKPPFPGYAGSATTYVWGWGKGGSSAQSVQKRL